MARKYKTALVTGASAGMGKDFAFRLLNEGMTVYAAARSVGKMKDLEEAGAIILPMDITKEEDVDAAVAAITERTGGVDVLINNAGYGQYGPVEETPIDTARYQFEVNIFGLARITQLLLPAMREKKQGLIINISSVGGKIYTPLGAWYHATKHALEGWSDSMRLELEPMGIHVVVIEPGGIDTEFGDALSANLKGNRTGPYGDFLRRISGAMERMESQGLGSPPSVITDLVVRAIRADRPKTRYSAGAFSWSSLTLRWLLPDRWFDRAIMSQMK